VAAPGQLFGRLAATLRRQREQVSQVVAEAQEALADFATHEPPLRELRGIGRAGAACQEDRVVAYSALPFLSSGLRKNLNSDRSCRIRKAAVQGRHSRLVFHSHREVDGIQRPEHDGGTMSKFSGSFTVCADDSHPS